MLAKQKIKLFQSCQDPMAQLMQTNMLLLNKFPNKNENSTPIVALLKDYHHKSSTQKYLTVISNLCYLGLRDVS